MAKLPFLNFQIQWKFGEPTPTSCVFMGHEFGVSGHGDDRRPHRCSWACPRSIVSHTTGKRFRDSIGTALIVWRAGTSLRGSIPKPGPATTLHKIARQAEKKGNPNLGAKPDQFRRA